MDAPVREVFHTPPGMSAPIEPLLLYQASQDEKCRHWVDSVYNRMNLREKVGQLFIYTIAPVQTKRNMQLLRDTTKPANKYLLFILYCKKPFTSTIPVYITTDKSLPGLLVVSSCCSAFHSRHRDKDDYSGRYRPGRSPDQPKHKYP